MFFLRIILVVGLLGAFVAAGITAYSSEAREDVIDLRGRSEVSIVLTDGGFEPKDVLITRGTKVTFTTTRDNQFWPASNSHPAHLLFPEFDPRQPVEPDAAWSFTFEKVGLWPYHDHIRSYFTGLIYVDP